MTNREEAIRLAMEAGFDTHCYISVEGEEVVICGVICTDEVQCLIQLAKNEAFKEAERYRVAGFSILSLIQE